jgi:hypothetical protein
MHIAIEKIVEVCRVIPPAYNLSDSSLTTGDVLLEVKPDTSSSSPTSFRLSWPDPVHFTDTIFPAMLMRFVIGNDFDHVALLRRQAGAVQRGERYSERIGAWDYSSFYDHGRWIIVLSVA